MEKRSNSWLKEEEKNMEEREDIGRGAEGRGGGWEKIMIATLFFQSRR